MNTVFTFTLESSILVCILQEKGRDELQKSSSSRLNAFVMDVSKCNSVKNGYDYVKQYIPEDSGELEFVI